jgi:hypothetical protein
MDLEQRISYLEAADKQKDQLISDLLKATGLSPDPQVRIAQMSITANTGQEIGWWIGAIGLMSSSKLLLSTSMPELDPIIREGAPWILGFMLGGKAGAEIGRQIGTGIAFSRSEGSFFRQPAESIIPPWFKYLSPTLWSQRILSRVLSPIPAFQKLIL